MHRSNYILCYGTAIVSPPFLPIFVDPLGRVRFALAIQWADSNGDKPYTLPSISPIVLCQWRMPGKSLQHRKWHKNKKTYIILWTHWKTGALFGIPFPMDLQVITWDLLCQISPWNALHHPHNSIWSTPTLFWWNSCTASLDGFERNFRYIKLTTKQFGGSFPLSLL